MDLKTCEPWGLTVTGGIAPYNVTLISVGSTVVTNVTLPQGFDVLAYISRANPNGEILGMFYACLPRRYVSLIFHPRMIYSCSQRFASVFRLGCHNYY
jgi:hypothetical protein